MADEELGPVLDAHPDPDAACRALVELALDREGKDNITVVVGRFGIGADRAGP